MNEPQNFSPNALEPSRNALELSPNASEPSPEALELSPNASEPSPNALRESPNALGEGSEALGEEPRAPTASSEVRSGTTAPVKALVDAVRAEVAKAVVGQDEVIGQFLIALLVGGHVLLEGVPGVAKTLTAKALSHTLSAQFKRIQFTPDLMPSDVVGTNVFDARTGEFALKKGPVFTDLLLADEINRTPPKTQAALLEAMQERRVTIDGESHVLSPLFTVLATQNPIDYEGTYPLPEAQIDRFLIKVGMTYPKPEEEMALLERVHRGFDAHELAGAGLEAVATPERLAAARQAVKNVVVGEGIIRYITQIVLKTRDLATLTLGASPRAGIALLECSKALAAMNGRDFVIPEDVKTVALPVLRHRLLLRAESEMEGLRSDDVVRSVLGSVEVPR